MLVSSVNLPNRKSFSPDAAFYMGNDTGMKFFEGAPVFAAEVRSENDYGANVGARQLRRRSLTILLPELRSSGTSICLGEDVIRAYRAR